MYKVLYFDTKTHDINIIISASKANYKDWGFEKERHGFAIHIGKCHIRYNKYLHERIK